MRCVTNETALVRACLRLLALRRVPAWRNNSGAFVLGEGRARRFVRAGVKGGADILGALPPSGKLLAIETKVGRNKPTADQAAFLQMIEAAGGVAVVIRDVAELAQLLDRQTAPDTTRGPGDREPVGAESSRA